MLEQFTWKYTHLCIIHLLLGLCTIRRFFHVYVATSAVVVPWVVVILSIRITKP